MRDGNVLPSHGRDQERAGEDRPIQTPGPIWGEIQAGFSVSLVVTCPREGEGPQEAEEGQPGAGGGSPGSRSCPGGGTETGWITSPEWAWTPCCEVSAFPFAAYQRHCPYALVWHRGRRHTPTSLLLTAAISPQVRIHRHHPVCASLRRAGHARGPKRAHLLPVPPGVLWGDDRL